LLVRVKFACGAGTLPAGLARSGERDPVVIYGSILRERLPKVAR
jgi:hypothetical protein